MKHWIWLLVAGMALTGCAGIKQVPLGAIADVPDAAQATIVPVANAALARELAVQKTLQVYLKEYTKALKNSGFKMEFGMLLVNGQEAYLPTAISFSESPTITQKLPTRPAPHPAWDTANTLIRVGVPYAAGAYIADGLFGAVEHAVDRAGPHVNAEQYFNQQVSTTTKGDNSPATTTTSVTEPRDRVQEGIPLEGLDFEGGFEPDSLAQCLAAGMSYESCLEAIAGEE